MFLHCNAYTQEYGILILEDILGFLYDYPKSSAYPNICSILMQMLVDGREPDRIKEIALNLISRKKKGITILRHMIIAESIYCIFLRIDPQKTEHRLHKLLHPTLYPPRQGIKLWQEHVRKNYDVLV